MSRTVSRDHDTAILASAYRATAIRAARAARARLEDIEDATPPAAWRRMACAAARARRAYLAAERRGETRH